MLRWLNFCQSVGRKTTYTEHDATAGDVKQPAGGEPFFGSFNFMNESANEDFSFSFFGGGDAQEEGGTGEPFTLQFGEEENEEQGGGWNLFGQIHDL